MNPRDNGERTAAGAGTSAMTPQLSTTEDAVTVAVSSCALFNMVEEMKVYKERGLDSYLTYQLEHEEEPLKPGVAFPFVKAVMMVNAQLRELYPESNELFHIVLETSNHAQVGVRLINSINHYNLPIEQFFVTGGDSPDNYLAAYNPKLYLSKDATEVKKAIDAGIAAATMFSLDNGNEPNDKQLCVAFDGDGVLFSDEAEIITHTQNLKSFFQHEQKNENRPLPKGPLYCFSEALGKLQKKFYHKNKDCPIRTYLVTSRNAFKAGGRALKTLRSYGLEIDEMFFLSGSSKAPYLQTIRPHIFFDDQKRHVDEAQNLGTVAAHVPYGIAQS